MCPITKKEELNVAQNLCQIRTIVSFVLSAGALRRADPDDFDYLNP